MTDSSIFWSIFSFEINAHTGCAQDFDGTGSILAHAYYPEDGRVHLDDDELFTDQTSVGTNLYTVLVHEIGHALGLGHSFVTGAVMNPVYQGYNGGLTLHEDDINGLRLLYGRFYICIRERKKLADQKEIFPTFLPTFCWPNTKIFFLLNALNF